MDMWGYHIQNPEAFLLLLLIPVLIADYIYRLKKQIGRASCRERV